MPDLGSAAIADWIVAYGSNDLASMSQQQQAETVGIAAATIALGSALDAATLRAADVLVNALETTDLACDLSAVMARFGPDRRLRLLHWLTEAGFDNPHSIIARITDPATPGGAALQQWFAAVLRREMLGRLFARDRLEALRITCERAARQQEENTQ